MHVSKESMSSSVSVCASSTHIPQFVVVVMSLGNRKKKLAPIFLGPLFV